MFKLISFACLTISLPFLAKADCQYQLDQQSVEVKWTAFKTPEKAPVGGTFKKVQILELPNDKSASIEKSSLGAKFSIDSQTVSTNDPGRDLKIAKFFFGQMKKSGQSAPLIAGEIVEASEKSLTLQIEMNGERQKVTLESKLEGEKLLAKGTLDVLDFAMDKQLQNLTQVCKEKHKNKTWPDVGVELAARFIKKCQ